jgi:putative oxidoreductase
MFDVMMKSTVVPLILRLALAAVFIYHGSQMISPENNWGAAWANRAAERQSEQTGKPPEVLEPLRNPAAQLAVAWGEFLGGVALALGLLTRLAALGIIVIMAGAIYTVHLPHGFDITQHGYEYNVVIIAVCLALILMGGGTLAADRWVRLRRKPIVRQ